MAFSEHFSINVWIDCAHAWNWKIIKQTFRRNVSGPLAGALFVDFDAATAKELDSTLA